MITTCLPSHDGKFNPVENKFWKKPFESRVAQEGRNNKPERVGGINWREVDGETGLFSEFVVVGERGDVPGQKCKEEEEDGDVGLHTWR